MVIEEASSLIYARMKVALADLTKPETFAEGRQLTGALSKRAPKKMIGRLLSQRDA